MPAETELRAALTAVHASGELKGIRSLVDLISQLLETLKSPGDRAADSVQPKPTGQVEVPSNASGAFEEKVG